MAYSLPGSSVHGILQARILEWVAMPSSRGSSQTWEWTQVSYMVGWFFTADLLGKSSDDIVFSKIEDQAKETLLRS